MRLAVLFTVILIPAIATGQSDRPGSDDVTVALRGLSTVDLVAEAFGDLADPKQASLALRTALESRLGLNGIRAEHVASKTATSPRLHLTVYVVRSDDFKHYAYDVSLTVTRMVQVFVPSENRNRDIRATVWHKSLLRIVLAGNTGRMREAAEELARAFVSDFLAANPKTR